MRSFVLALAVLLTACGGAGRDRYLPKFGAAETIATPAGPVVLAVGEDGRVYYGERRSFGVHVIGDEAPRLLFTLPHRPDSMVVDRDVVYVSTKTMKGRVVLFRNEAVLWEGPRSRFGAHLTLSDKRELIVGLGDDVLLLDRNGAPAQKPTVISSGWRDPVVTAGRGSDLWVADNGLPGEKERVARGRERRVEKRNRFASTLPAYTNPTGMVLLDDQLLLCSRTHRKVYRLHIGIDDVARRRDWMEGLRCDRSIAADAQGGLYTAAGDAIYHYPPA